MQYTNRPLAIQDQISRQLNPISTILYWQLCILLYMENTVLPGNGFSQSLKSPFAKYPSVISCCVS